MYYVYILQSKTTGKHYIGSTNDPDRRLKEHNGNQTISLKNKGPFVIIYKETFTTLRLARKRESEIKSYKGGNAFKKLIKGFYTVERPALAGRSRVRYPSPAQNYP